MKYEATERLLNAALCRVMEANEVNVAAFTVSGHSEEVEDAGKPGFAGKPGRDVRKANGGDGFDLDFAFAHAIAIAGLDVGAGPDADGAGNFTADDSVSEAFGKDHD